ncbi:dimethylaniline monooxygenase [Rhypophila decipiens]
MTTRDGRPLGSGRVAVVGAGPQGLTMLKALREDGYNVTAYERRERVGGLWAWTENPSYTTALQSTRANISKFTCGFTDYPIPDKYNTYMTPQELQEFMQDYAEHFDLLKDIVFGANVNKARRNADDSAWLLDIEKENGSTETVEYDKVAFCSGYQSKAIIPTFEGQDKFEGTIIHSQAFRNENAFKDKNVVVVGLSSTAGDIIPALMPVASKVYISHRRGALPYRRYRNKVPNDLLITWRRRTLSQTFVRYFPRLSKWAADKAVTWFTHKMWPNLDPTWRMAPFPSITLKLPGSFELVMPYLENGQLTSLHGLVRFTGPKSLEFADGTILDDIDAVVLCTGYTADWSPLTPDLIKTSMPKNSPWYKGPPLYRLYMNMFPPEYADSLAVLTHSAFGKSNGFSFGTVIGWAVSNVFRGVEPLPPLSLMNAQIDAHHDWIASRWKMDPATDTSAVKQWEYSAWLHNAAGTGMENLGWGWKGWKFWWKDAKMYRLMNHGVDTAHAAAYFETGKRPVWEGAREAILHANEVVGKMFPLKEVDWPPEDHWVGMGKGKKGKKGKSKAV